MLNLLRYIAIIILCICLPAYASVTPTTKRIPQISNTQVNVWQTVIYPTKKQHLAMHRHDHNRVVVALDDGILKVTNDKNQVHYLKLHAGESYYLKPDPKNELHSDENITNHLIRVVVIELK